MSRGQQPVFQLTSGMQLRPWEVDDAQVLADSCLDPEIQQWNRPGRLSIEDAQSVDVLMDAAQDARSWVG
ncbi:hypothetical protein ACWEN3_31535 [Streptomyces sp. NPDC004561]